MKIYEEIMGTLNMYDFSITTKGLLKLELKVENLYETGNIRYSLQSHETEITVRVA